MSADSAERLVSPGSEKLRPPIAVAAGAAIATIVLAAGYAGLALLDVVPMSGRIFIRWLAALQAVHGALALIVWRLSTEISVRTKILAFCWIGVVAWYWLPAPIYFLLTMNIDELQLKWTVLAYLWEVPAIGGGFLLAAWRAFPSRALHRVLHAERDPTVRPERLYRALLRYPKLVALLIFVFTLVGYALGALQLELFAYPPAIEMAKDVLHGVVISVLLGVFYYMSLERLLEPVRSEIARKHALTSPITRAINRRIFGVTVAVTIGGFALISLFVLQAFQQMIKDAVAETVENDVTHLAAEFRASGTFDVQWPPRGEHGRIFLLGVKDELPAADFSPETRRRVAEGDAGVIEDFRRDLKLVGFREVPGGKIVTVVVLTDFYGPLRTAAGLLGIAGVIVLVVTVGMLTFVTRASTRAVRALSSAVRQVEAGEADESAFRIDTADEIQELSGVVARYVRQSRDLQQNLENKVGEKTRELSAKLEEIERVGAEVRRSAERLEALRQIDRGILATQSAEEIIHAALPRLRRIVPYRWATVVLFEGTDEARLMAVDGEGGPREGLVLPAAHFPSTTILSDKGVRYVQDLAERRGRYPVFDQLVNAGTRSLISAPLIASGQVIGLLSVAAAAPRAFEPAQTEIVSEVANQFAVALHQAQLRSALDAEQRRIQAVVEQLPEGVLLLDEERRITFANPAARSYLPCLATLSSDATVTTLGGAELDELLEQMAAWREVSVRDGERLAAFQLSAAKLAGPSGTLGSLVVLRDVTEERGAQQTAERQARLAAVGQLAAGIAHDFNNILTTIINSADLADRHLCEPAYVRERLGSIVSQGHRAAALVKQILDFSRQSTPSLRPTDLFELVSETSKLLKRTLPETIRLVVDIEPTRLVVDADVNQLSRVLTNLAINARDAMPDGGELRLRLARLTVRADEAPPRPGVAAGDWVVLEVSDTGVGMPPAIRDRVFEPFFTTKAGRGTGLGLSQAYGIVQQHRGHIALESEPGRGTTFTIFFPALAAPAAIVPEAPAAPTVTGSGQTLLIVEDDPDVRQTLCDALTELNYHVLSAASGEDALALYAQHTKEVALVLTDVVMPGMGGIGLLETLRAQGSSVNVVMMSGYAEGGVKDRSALSGIRAWVDKPVSPHRLAEIIRDILHDGRAPARSAIGLAVAS